MFECDYGIDCLTDDMNICQEIKSWMVDFIEENPYNLLFNTNSLVVKHRNMWPYNEYFLETIDYERTGSFERLEFFREGERLHDRINSRLNQINERLRQNRINWLNQINQESRESKEEIEKEEPVINTEQTFKEDECIICLTNPPNVLFCNCGHIAICVEGDKVKSLKDCPMCKTETTIKRTSYI